MVMVEEALRAEAGPSLRVRQRPCSPVGGGRREAVRDLASQEGVEEEPGINERV